MADVEFNDETQGLPSTGPAGYSHARAGNKNESWLVRLMMKMGARDTRQANVFLLIAAGVFALAAIGVWIFTRDSTVNPEDLPPDIRDQLELEGLL